MGFYRQCKLKRFGRTRIAWIREDEIKVGSLVKFKGENSDFGRAYWKVISVGITRRKEAPESIEIYSR
ncbi:MAG: hypothetical protein HRU19_30960 [Pseudobacteriovorax sp.]|nr:hypothetical protein [Pseudobacteriovorax sp.]